MNKPKTAVELDDKLKPITMFAAIGAFLITQIIWYVGKNQTTSLAYYNTFVVADVLFLYNFIYHYKNDFGFGGIFVSMFAMLIATIDAFYFHIKPVVPIIILNVILVIFLLQLIIVTFKMVYTILASSKDVCDNATILILGTKTIDGKPSKELKARLDKALSFNNKNVNYIVSGGKVQEDYSEADVMKEYLLEKGVSENRIFIDDKANNSVESIKYSKVIIKENNLDNHLYVLSTNYHLYRVGTILKRNDIDAKLIGVFNPTLFFLQRWGREVLNIFLNYRYKKAKNKLIMYNILCS